MSTRPPLPAHQRGVALITAVMIVALATIAAAAIALAGDAAIHRATILQETERAWWYAKGAQSWARTILERDAEDTEFDALTEEWAMPIDYLPVDEGFITGQIVDQQGLFNLNNLGADNNGSDYARYLQQFERLLGQIEGLDPFLAQQLGPAIHDWIDEDYEPTPYDGAEDNEYLGLERPYRAANRLMHSVSELLLVRGMTPDVYRALLPYVTALPEIGTPINVNTAPDAVMLALVDGSPGAAFQSFLTDRLEEPAEDLSEIAPGMFGANGATAGDITVDSSYFLLRAETTIGNSRVALSSLFLRDGGMPVLLAQSTDQL